MIRDSIHHMTKAFVKAARNGAGIGALAVFLLPFNLAHAGATPASASYDDNAVQEQVYQALNADPMHFFRHVDVQVRNGVVTLDGYVWSVSSLYRAETIAAAVPGVRHVVDRMELQNNGLTPHA